MALECLRSALDKNELHYAHVHRTELVLAVCSDTAHHTFSVASIEDAAAICRKAMSSTSASTDFIVAVALRDFYIIFNVEILCDVSITRRYMGDKVRIRVDLRRKESAEQHDPDLYFGFDYPVFDELHSVFHDFERAVSAMVLRKETPCVKLE